MRKTPTVMASDVSSNQTGKPTLLDSHVHFWDPRKTPRAVSGLVRVLGFSPQFTEWVANRISPREVVKFFGTVGSLVRPFLPEHLDGDARHLPLEGVVHVEAGWLGKGALGSVGETVWLEQLETTCSTQIKAIVAHADLANGERVCDVLEAHLEASQRVRSIRDMLSWHSRANIFNLASAEKRSASDVWREGFAQLSRFGLRFDATIYHHQMDELADLATCFPHQPIVLCHLGMPVATGGAFGGLGTTAAENKAIESEWQDSMARLAACGNVHVKLSGLLMPVCGFGFEATGTAPSVAQVVDAIGPYIQFAIDTFGVDRCQFASNFPVEKFAVSYETLWEAFHAVVASRSGDDQAALFRGNAMRFYGIGS